MLHHNVLILILPNHQCRFYSPITSTHVTYLCTIFISISKAWFFSSLSAVLLPLLIVCPRNAGSGDSIKIVDDFSGSSVVISLLNQPCIVGFPILEGQVLMQSLSSLLK